MHCDIHHCNQNTQNIDSIFFKKGVFSLLMHTYFFKKRGEFEEIFLNVVTKG